jgi:hypothetical protein
MRISIRTSYLALVLALGLPFSGCGSSEDRSVVEAGKETKEKEWREFFQTKILPSGDTGWMARSSSGIYYIRDDRVGLCFAYMWGGGGYGGPGLAEVPCEKVKHLLTPSQQKKMEQE